LSAKNHQRTDSQRNPDVPGGPSHRRIGCVRKGLVAALAKCQPSCV
jgi:hypothetical protein